MMPIVLLTLDLCGRSFFALLLSLYSFLEDLLAMLFYKSIAFKKQNCYSNATVNAYPHKKNTWLLHQKNEHTRYFIIFKKKEGS